MASVAIPMVAGFAAQKLATDVLGVDPKMAAVLGMAAGGGAGAWASGGGSFGSLFGNTAGAASAGSAAPTIGQNMFGQTAGMAGMSPKVGGGLISAAGTTAGAVPASLGYNAHAAGTHGMDMFASSVNPQTFTGVNAPFSSMASGNGYAGTPYTPIDNSFNPYLGPNVGNADAPADIGYFANPVKPNPYIGANVGNADAPAQLFQTNPPILQMDTQMNTQMPDFSGPRMNPQMNTEINPQMFAPSQYDQMASMYPGMDDPSMYMNTSATTTPLPNRPEIPSQNYDPINQNYQADDDMYTAQLFRDGNTVSGSGVADSTSWNMADDLDYAELGGGGDSISKDMEYQKWLNDKTLQEQGLSYDDMAATNPTQGQMQPGSAKNWVESTPEYDSYVRATHGMDDYAQSNITRADRMRNSNLPQVDQAIANTRPNPAEVGGNTSDWSKQSGTTRADRMRDSAVERQSDKISKSLDELTEGDDKPRWWDKSENQQFLMQAAKILLSDDIEEQQVSSGGGGGGGPPSPGVYSGGSSPAPKVVFGMGPYNGQGQQGYNPREIM